LSRYARAVRAEEEGYHKLRVLSEALAREPGYRLRGIARRMLQAQMLDAVAALPDLALDGVSAERLSLVLARLERTARG
jgi:putative heme iron utilization protein